MDQNYQDSLSLLPLNKQKLVVKLRGIFLSASLEIKETVKFGRMTFVTNKEPVAFICVKNNSDFIEVGFFKAIYLNDPKGLFKGKSKEIRRIRIGSEKEIPVSQIKRWVREAVKLKVEG